MSTTTLTALVGLAWPFVFVVVFTLLFKRIAKLLDSAQNRKVTIKIAGNELTLEQASEQQINLIKDLQNKTEDLERRLSAISGQTPPSALEMIGSPNAEAPSAELSEISEAANEREIDSDEANSAKAANVSRVVPKRLLWVDDKPASNALIVELLRERGVSTDAVTSSEEGLERLEALQYDAVITDMNRPEGKRAGLSFTRDVRSRDRDVPVIIYCGSTNAQKLKEEAKEAGAQLITDSTSDLLAMLAQLGLGRGR